MDKEEEPEWKLLLEAILIAIFTYTLVIVFIEILRSSW